MDAKKAVVVLLVVFLGFWMFNDPNGLAQVARDGASEGWSLTQQLFRAIIDFMGALF